MRLIAADELKEKIRNNVYLVSDVINSRDYGMFWVGIEQAIDEASTVDAEPVIRCKDCKYWEDGYCDDSLIEGLERKVSRFEDDFCSRGEKR